MILPLVVACVVWFFINRWEDNHPIMNDPARFQDDLRRRAAKRAASKK